MGSLEASGVPAADRKPVARRLLAHIAEAQGAKEYRGPNLRLRHWTGS